MLEIIRGYNNFFLSNRLWLLPRVAAGVFNRVILKRPYLRVAEIATTFSCNSKCVMCSCSKFHDIEKEKTRMAVNEYESLGRQLDKLGCVSVNVTGGEPLVRTDIADVIVALNPRNKIINLITNGINLTKDSISRYASLGIDSIVVSLESTNLEENDKIRGHNGHFQAVMKAMQWAKENRLKFGVSLTLGDFNFSKVYELMEFAKSNGIFLCLAHGGSIGNWSNNNSISLSKANADKILALIKKQKYMKIDFSANLSLRPGCPAIVEKLYITPYGDVLPCAFIPISFGSLRDEPLDKIWQRMKSFYKNNVSAKTLCLRTYNDDFKEKLLFPIKNMKHPVEINKHPFFNSNVRQKCPI